MWSNTWRLRALCRCSRAFSPDIQTRWRGADTADSASLYSRVCVAAAALVTDMSRWRPQSATMFLQSDVQNILLRLLRMPQPGEAHTAAGRWGAYALASMLRHMSEGKIDRFRHTGSLAYLV